MKKKILLTTLLLVIGIALLFSGCNSYTDEPQSDIEPALEIEPQPETETQYSEHNEQVTPKPIEPEILECTDEENDSENADNSEVKIGVIYGDIYFKGIALSQLFKDSFIDPLGEPMSLFGEPTDKFGEPLDFFRETLDRRVTFFYEEFYISIDDIDNEGKVRVRSLGGADNLKLFEINGISLDMTPDEFISTFGPPNEILIDIILVYFLKTSEVTFILDIVLCDREDITVIESISIMPTIGR